MASRSNIVCIGNELHGDDGFGPALFEVLAGQPLPAGTRLMRCDPSSPRAIGCFEHCERVVLVDALRGFGPVGSLHCLAPEQLAVEMGGAHGVGVGALLRLLPALLERVPEIRLVGVEAGEFRPFAAGLSQSVEKALPAARAMLVELLS